MGGFIDIKPEIIRWAVRRAGLSIDDLRPKFRWIDGTKLPTFLQLHTFANTVHIPFGYLFLAEPPVEKLPIADFRTFDDDFPEQPSPDLLDTIYGMQRRQEWMREEMIAQEVEPIPFIGSLLPEEPVKKAAAKIRQELFLTDQWVFSNKKTDDRFEELRNAAENLGILVFLSGTVGNNPHRALDNTEFRGFALSDQHAPLIFINRNDSITAQLFTLAHELAHLALGISGVSNLGESLFKVSNESLELRCNNIAAEILVPAKLFAEQWKETQEPLKTLHNVFGVSRIVIARRALDLKFISGEHFFGYFNGIKDDLEKRKNGTSGGNFYNTINHRLPRRFSRAVIAAVSSGGLLHRDAYHLLGISGTTFDTFAKKIKEGKND